MTTTQHRTTTVLAATALAALLVTTGCGGGTGGSDGSDGSRGNANGGRTAPVQPGPNGGAASPQDDFGVDEQGRPSLRDSRLIDPREDAQSTFALDIDTGSYTRFRDAVRQGRDVNPSEVRTEEFVNYFRQDYQAPREGLSVSIDAAVLPFLPDRRFVRVGIRSADVSSETRRDTDLVVVVDCSGSMGDAGKMETTKGALRTLVTSLRPSDRVAMVCYSTDARVLLEPTRVSERDAILAAVDELRPEASTNAEAGLTLGYDLADAMRTEGRMTRVVLVSDGVANVGSTTAGDILDRIGDHARAGVNLVSVGVGIDTYNDELLEQLADRGDGWHVYVDTAAEAERVFATGLTSSLVVTGRDAKAQVTFDPGVVAGYRLIGYENRAVADEDFRNDGVDGGEVFAGHATTALYEVEMRDGAPDGAFVTATVRYRDSSGETVERSGWLADRLCADHLSEAAPRLRQDLVIALLTDHLVGGPWSNRVSVEDLRAEATRLTSTLDGDRDVVELADLVHRVTA